MIRATGGNPIPSSNLDKSTFKQPDRALDDLALLAAHTMDTPFAAITLRDEDGPFVKSCIGVDTKKVSEVHAFAQNQDEVTIVEDARKDKRFKSLTCVTKAPHFVFYAGVALKSPDGEQLGTLAVLDRTTRKLTSKQTESLHLLARQVIQLLELKKSQNPPVQKSYAQPDAERLKNIVEATRVGTWEWNVQTGELRINDRWAEIIGYTKEELEPINIDLWYKVIHPDDIERTDQGFQACFNKEVVFYDAQCRMLHKDGHEVWIHDRGGVVSWTDDGKPLWMMGTHTDITEEKNTEKQLLTISDNIPGAVFRYRLSPQGEDFLEMVSKGAYELWGVTAEKAMEDNSTVWKYFDIDDVERVRESIRSSARTLSPWQCEWRHHHPNGEIRWHSGSGNPWRSEDGSTVWDAMILDVTDQKKAEMERDSYLHALEERIKERTVLYHIVQLSNEQIPVTALLQKAVGLMPGGWQYPEITSAKITYGKKTFKSDRFKKTKWSQSVQRLSGSGKKLEVTVAYAKQMPDEDHGPFLKEEGHLLNNIADNLIMHLNHRAAIEQNERILQSTREGIYGIDEKGACTFINNAAAQMLGYTVSECLGQNMHQLIHHHTESGDSYPEAECPVYKSRNEIEGCRVNNEVFWTKKNEAIPVRYSSTSILVDGKFKGAVVVFNDISDTKKAEREIELREKRYRALVENGADAILILDKESRVTYVSPSIKRVLGYNETEALELNLLEVIHPDDLPGVLAKMHEVLKFPGTPIPGYTARTKHKDGSWRWLEATITNLLHDPVVNGIIDNFRDVTERVEFEQSLKDSEEKYRSLFDTSPLPMWIYDLNTGGILDVNQTTTEKYGYSREEFLNLHITELRPESELPALKLVAKTAKNMEGTKRFGVFTHLKKNGESMRMDVSGHRLLYDSKDSLLVVCNEVTEQEAAFNALEASEARYRGFYESQTNYVIRTDMDGNYSYVNKKFEDDFGWAYPGGSIIGSNSLTSIMEYDHSKVFEVVEKCVQSPGKVHKVEIDKPSKGRGTVTTLWEFVCILNDRGEPGEIQCVGLDITDRITTERALSESHERYELVNRATNDAIYDWDVKNDRFVWGDGFYRILNYPRDQFKTFNLEDWIRLTHPADSAAHKEEWEQFLADENAQKWENEFRFQRADGSYAYVGEIGYMIRDENGRPERMIGVLRDQTQVKLAEIQQGILRDVSQRFKESGSLSATLQDVLKYLTETGKFRIAEIWLKSDYDNHLNRVAQYSKSRSGQIFLSESTGCERLKQGEGLPGAVWNKKELIVWNDVQSQETFVRRKAAAKAGLLTMIGVPILHNEQVVGVMVLGSAESNCKTESNVELIRAIGPFLGAEIIRKNQEEELHLFFKNAPEILTVVNPNGYFSKVNPAFVQTLGYTEDELTSQPILHFLHPDDVATTSKELDMNISGEHLADNFVNRFRTKEGAYKWISWKSSKTFGRDGQFFGYGRDITKQKIADNDLQNRTRQLNAIATINSRLINYENWYQVIDESFAQIAEVVQVDRVYYFKNSIHQTTGQPVTSQVLEWTRENVEPQIDNPELQELPLELIGEFFAPMFKNDPYQGHSKNIKNTALREMLIDQDIKSILCLPIIVDKNIWGIIGFDDCTRERIWTADEVVFLRTIAANLATAIESHETDLKLKEAHDERSNILESIGDAFFAVDNNWVVTYWNKEAEKVLGKSKDDMLGKVLWDHYEDAKSLKFYDEYHNAMNTGKVVNFEEFYPGTNSWYEVSAYPSKKGLSVYFKDVTLRKHTHEQIRLTKERFEKVTQATNDAIWDFDVIKNELFWGQGFDTLFGYNAQNTTPTFELLLSKIHPEDRDRVAAKVVTYMKDGSATNWYEEYRFLKADGTFAYVIDRAVFIRNHQGEVTRVVGAMTDISYRKEHERKLQNLNEQLEKHARDLERSNAELEQFAYIASHDLQEPLRMVTSFLNQLDNKYNDQLDDKAQQYIYFAVDGARRMRQIILDLLEFSRVGRLEEKKTTIDLNEIIDGYSVLRKKAIEEKSAVIRYDTLPELTTYKTPVTQVFHNLIDNAIKYARPGVPPKVEIKATDHGNHWEFEVRDNGIGIEEEYFEKIFVIFQRLHNKSEYSGTGMGLAIVRKIVDNLGGKTWLKSTPGKGSSFHFTLPQQS